LANAVISGEEGIMTTSCFKANSINRRGFAQVVIFLALGVISGASAALVGYGGYVMFECSGCAPAETLCLISPQTAALQSRRTAYRLTNAR
jgi:hypothetical protein